MKRAAIVFSLFVIAGASASAQDIRGLENCSAEKQMERRTGCLQSNVEFLQQAIQKNAIESRQKLGLAEKEIAAAHKEIAVLKDTLGKMQAKLDELQKAKKDGK